MMNESTPGLLLNGLDGSNPLGFLAAIGTFRIAAQTDFSTQWSLSWREHGGSWAPVLHADKELTEDQLIEILMPVLQNMDGDPALNFSDDLTIDCQEFRKTAKIISDAATFIDRRSADFISAFGCDSLSISNKNSMIQDTALRTMSGAGHQHFLGTMRELMNSTESDHLRSSLFAPWQYLDPKPNLRWDPLDDRRYALQWKKPSPSIDPVRTMRGANRLAIEALPFFPTAPEGQKLHTTGFSQRWSKDVLFTWPIWGVSLSVEVVRSLLSFPEIQKSKPNRDDLIAIGVVDVYRSQRITVNKFRNFTNAISI